MNIIVLAGDRGPDDPLALQARVAGKTLVPVAGTAMLTRVLKTLSEWERLGQVVVVAPGLADYQQAIKAAELGSIVEQVAPESSPSQSVAARLWRSSLAIALACYRALAGPWLHAMSPSPMRRSQPPLQ